MFCGQHAVCRDEPINSESGPVLGTTTPVCSCLSPNEPIKSDTASMLVTPFTRGCDTPRKGKGVGVAAITIESIVLELVKQLGQLLIGIPFS